MKKVLSLVLALLMTISCASFIFADDEVVEDVAIAEEAAIADVVASPYDAAVKALYDLKVYKGYNENDLGTEKPVKRYEMALFVARISTGWVDDDQWEDGPSNTSEFIDLAGTPAENYLGAISYANQKGIILGYGDGKFGPEDGIKYQDALTMVVRTLGYDGLSYPWGYIEKAVALGLTNGIVGVAYTDTLNRGVVAQIINNALYAAPKEGENLLKAVFGIVANDVWEKVIITGTHLARYSHADQGTDSGVLAFKRLEADGKVSGSAFYVTVGTFGFKNDQEATQKLGYPFEVVLAYDESGSVVNVKEVKAMEAEVITDPDEVVKFIGKKVALVSKFTELNFLNNKVNQNTYNSKPEYMLMTAGDKYNTTAYYGINWETGDIVFYADGTQTFETVAYYNAILDTWFRYVFDDVVTAEGRKVIGVEKFDVNWADFKATTATLVDTAVYGTATTAPTKTAYPVLTSFDLTGDGAVDYGFYEEYMFGRFVEKDPNGSDEMWNQDWGKGVGVPNLSFHGFTGGHFCNIINFGHYGFAPVDGETFAQYSIGPSNSFRIELGTTATNYSADYPADGLYAGMPNPDGFWTLDERKTGAYCLITFNDVTNEMKVKQYLGAYEEGLDDYVVKGTLRAYDLTAATKTITLSVNGELVTLPLGYDLLPGAAFKGFQTYQDGILKDNPTAAAVYSWELLAMFNEFVEVAVVDGNVCAMSIITKDYSDEHGYTNAIIVQDYAGIDSNDGMIVIWGWDLMTGKLRQYRIATFANTYVGDWMYYGVDEDFFMTGSVLVVSSYDEDNDIYYVDLAGHQEDGKFVYDDASMFGTDTYGGWWDLTFDENGFRYDGGSYNLKCKPTDRYIIIGTPGEYFPFTPIYTYTGIPQAGWEVHGPCWDILHDTDSWEGRCPVFMETESVKGFNVPRNYEFVVVTDQTSYGALKAGYNGVGVGDGEYYLKGASVYTARVLNIANGKEMTVDVYNVNLKPGVVYVAVDGKILNGDQYIATIDSYADFLEWYYETDNTVVTWTQSTKDVAGNVLGQYSGQGGSVWGSGDMARAAYRHIHGDDQLSSWIQDLILGYPAVMQNGCVLNGLINDLVLIDVPCENGAPTGFFPITEDYCASFGMGYYYKNGNCWFSRYAWDNEAAAIYDDWTHSQHYFAIYDPASGVVTMFNVR